GSRFYVGSYYLDGGNICPQVSVFTTSSNTLKTTIAVPGASATAPLSPPICSSTRFRFSMAAGGDSSRVYLSNCDAGGVHIYDTSTDTFISLLLAPPSSRAPIVNNHPPPQNPVFLIAGP